MIIRWFERTPALLFILMALIVFGLIGAGVFLQWRDPLYIVPCHMCVFQRYLFLVIGAIALMAAFFAAKEVRSIRFFSLLLCLISVSGMYVSGVQSWQQRFTEGNGVCQIGGDDIYSFIIYHSPLTDMFPLVFKAEGDCNDLGWVFLNLSIANWSFIAFTVCAIAMILMFIFGGNAKKSPFH